MDKFITTIKTNYTNVKEMQTKKGFISPYSNKGGRILISGENRSVGEKYSGRLIK